jgi:hypothetical protein
MKQKPVLDGWEIPRISTIQTVESRSMVELAVPGMTGSLYQDLNSTPARIVITGSLYSDDVRDQFLNDLRGKYKAGDPVTFVADIVTATEVQYVVIDELRMEEKAGTPDEMTYWLALRESPPPPPPPDPLGGLDSGLLDKAKGLVDSAAGALDAITKLGSLPDLKDPTPPLKGTLDGVKSITGGLSGVGGGLKDLFG